MQPSISTRDVQPEMWQVPPESEIQYFSQYLDHWNTPYTVNGYYLQVGRVDQGQGWILDLTALETTVESLIETVVPILLYEKVAFKIPATRDIAMALLQGTLGYTEIGKIICIFPETPDRAVQLARIIQRESMRFTGPAVPTDFHLGSIVYTRYGGYNPIPLTDSEGVTRYFSCGAAGDLMAEEVAIPFRMPKGIAWPYSILKPYKKVKSKRLLKRKYLIIRVLKNDLKGRVMLAFRFKKWWNADICLIKEGIENMASDKYGRNIQDKIKWQYHLHKELENILPIPKANDLFEKDGNIYFGMEYIEESISSGSLIDEIHQAMPWEKLNPAAQQALTRHLLSIVDFVGKMHENGYYHRDITSRNFLVLPNKEFSIVGIDLELAWDFKLKQPNPPFILGSFGYMSPEQIRVETPTAEQDIFGLGALMLRIFTGLSPKLFMNNDADTLFHHLRFLIGHKSLAALISSCMNEDPEQRPNLQEVKHFVTALASEIELNKERPLTTPSAPNRDECREVIERGIACLGTSIMATEEKIWISKPTMQNNYVNNETRNTVYLPGFQKGVAGVLSFLADAHKAGFSIRTVMEHFTAGWEYLHSMKFVKGATAIPGLYHGSPGACLAFAKGVHADLLTCPAEMIPILEQALCIATEDLTLSTGLAGQGLAILECLPILHSQRLPGHVEKLANQIAYHQAADGSWLIRKTGFPKGLKLNDFANGIAGIVYFLLRYQEYAKDDFLMGPTIRGLNYLVSQIEEKEGNNTWKTYPKGSPVGPWFDQGVTGIVKPFITAYKVTGDDKYKTIAESVLYDHNPNLTTAYLSHSSGATGIGMVYLDAWEAFGTEKWFNRAGWIAQLLLHTYQCHLGDSICWVTDNTTLPTSDLLTGNTGILLFLMRWLDPKNPSFSIFK
jgi:serine/threonine protein kinase